jgi:pimeloyl-ACP methyl ester carboxylesterase
VRRLDFQPPAPPGDLGKIPFKSLYVKELYDAPTQDGWVLRISRYRPVAQGWEQPILGEPILLVPGWSQNRHCFTCGDFVKQLLAFGADVHILELRGHGRSSRELQLERGLTPKDLDWGWDLDSYFLHDIPAGVQAVKKKTGRAKIFYLGASMGGMLGYGYAGCHDDLAGMVTIGAPSDLGRLGFPGLRAVALLAPALLGPLIDAACRAASGILRRPVRFNHVPVDAFMRAAATGRVRYALRALFNPARVAEDELCFLLSQGGEKEPRRVVEQFARWIRDDEMKCYATGYDYKAHFRDIRIPMAVIYGALDRIASRQSTRSIYRDTRSAYLLRRPVKENSHLELTMGSDIRQICEDVKDLMAFAARSNSLGSAAAHVTVARRE